MNILYLCDRRACKTCGPECFHTTDITHAKNFKLVGDGYFENPAPLMVLKFPPMLKAEDKQRIRDDIDRQIKEGSGIILTECFVRVSPSDDGKFDDRILKRSLQNLGVLGEGEHND